MSRRTSLPQNQFFRPNQKRTKSPFVSGREEIKRKRAQEIVAEQKKASSQSPYGQQNSARTGR